MPPVAKQPTWATLYVQMCIRDRHIMDVATGTGDFAILACRELQPDSLIGTDISEGMMNVGREKVKQAHLSNKISFVREDCTSLSFADESFDAVTVAFGIRNFEGLDKGLSEMCRVLKTGGHLVLSLIHILHLRMETRHPQIPYRPMGCQPTATTGLRSTFRTSGDSQYMYFYPI